MASSHLHHRGVSLGLLVLLALHQGASLDLREKPLYTSSESSKTSTSNAVDGNLSTFSQTNFGEGRYLRDPWWKVDLQAIYCLKRITVVHRRNCCEWRIAGAVVRAGMSYDHLQNAVIGSPVTCEQAVERAIVDFVLDPTVSAQYVSVDKPGCGPQNIVHLAEFLVEQVVEYDETSMSTVLSLTTSSSTTQSSTYQDTDSGMWSAARAVDGVEQYVSPYCSQTNEEVDPWWRLDLMSDYCLQKIAIRNVDDPDSDVRLRLRGAVVRAGMSDIQANNNQCGTPVTQYQALLNEWIEFTCTPSVLARYVSVSIQGTAILILCEVTVLTCYLQPPALLLTDNRSTQSSTMDDRVAARALDLLPVNPYCSQTNLEINPWWSVDLVSDFCLGKISIKNDYNADDSVRIYLEGAIVRAGLSDNHTNNMMCGTSVTRDQALSNGWIDSVCDPPVLARYVSVDIPKIAALKLCEVMVSTCDLQLEGNRVDFTLVTHPAVLDETGDSDTIIAAYRGPHDITADVLFGRQLRTGGSTNELPSGSVEVADARLGCTARILSLPDQGGIDRTGVFYCVATKNDLNTRIQTVILPKDEGTVQVSPVQRTQTASVGDSVILRMQGVNSPNSNYRWRHDGGHVIESWNDRLEVSITTVAKEHEGVYTCFASGQENRQLHGIMRLIVRDCPPGMWDPPDCRNTCRRCYNGGVCDDKTGTCICAPGFSGENCGQVHGRHVFGREARHSCSSSIDPHNHGCRGHLFCLPDPYGCSCAAGYMGLNCMQECEEGTYGADCKQTCHCAPGVTCSKDTGECDGSCESPYFGSNCQCSTENGVLGLQVTSGDPRQLFVTWQPDSCTADYALQYRLTNTDQCDERASPQQMAQNVSHFFTGLEPSSNYTVSIRPSYNGILGPDVSYPQTIRPSEPPFYVTLTSATPRVLVFSWSKPPCRGRGGIITGYSYRLTETASEANVASQIDTLESVTLDRLTPSTEYSFQVAARTAAGTGPYSEALVTRTLEEATGISAALAGGTSAAFLVLIITIIVFTVVCRRRTSQVRRTSGIGENILLERRNTNIAPDKEHANRIEEEVNAQTPQPELPPRPTQPVAQSSQREEYLQQSNTTSPIYANETGEEVNAQTPQPELPPRPTQPVAQSSQGEKYLQPFRIPRPLRVDELADYIRKKKLAGIDGFDADHKNLPDGLSRPWTVAKKPENMTKNRYANVVPYDHSRIVLKPLEIDPHSDYINACYIDGYKETDKYIASQGPNKATVADMWRMVWQMNVDRIVTLANPVENGKRKYRQYWPDSGSTVYSDIMVTLVKQAVYLDYTIRFFEIQQAASEKGIRSVKQFHYTTWPDMKPPEYPTPLLNFLRVVNADRSEGRTLIHCSAGVGRTGTYIALDAMLEQMEQEGQVNVPCFIYHMRKKRTSMVHTLEQYKFVFDALLAAFLTGDTTYLASDLRQQMAALTSMESGASKTGMEKQFQTLAELRAKHGSKNLEIPFGKLLENVHKNRFKESVPTDRSRVRLMTKAHEDDNDYINATYLPGYRRKNTYIGTQMPMPDTVADFWRMVYDQKSTCIVMLNPLDTNDETMCQYWPDDGSIEFGPLVVELLETKEYAGVIGRKLSLRNKNEEPEVVRTVSQFQYLDWPSEKEVPSSLQGMQTLVELTLQRQRERHPIVVHCVDGLGRTSVYCAVMTLVKQSNEENVVDVFQAVLRLRMIDHNMMYSLKHYAMCHDVLQRYLDSTAYINVQ